LTVLNLLGEGVRVVTVEPPTTMEVCIGVKLIVVEVGMVDGGMTKVQGGKHPRVGLGSTKMVGSIYTTPEPFWLSPPISAPARARTSQALTSVV
jgi:hypothetical protein